MPLISTRINTLKVFSSIESQSGLIVMPPGATARLAMEEFGYLAFNVYFSFFLF